MKILLRPIALLLMLLASLAAAGAQMSPQAVAKQPTWAQLTSEQQKILEPIAKDWDTISDYQRQRILATAKRYPKMTAEQQQRFTKRLPVWSKLTLEQRNLARERFKQFQSLSPEQKARIRRDWSEHPPQMLHSPGQTQEPPPTSTNEEPNKPDEATSPKI